MENKSPAHTSAEVRAAAEKVGAWLHRLSQAVAQHLENAAAEGIDPNGLLDASRDALVAHGLGKVQAANVVRLGVHSLNKKYGLNTYTEPELRIICERVAQAA